MTRRPQPPIEQTEQPDDALMELLDDGELNAYEMVDGKLVKTVVRPARPPVTRTPGRST